MVEMLIALCGVSAGVALRLTSTRRRIPGHSFAKPQLMATLYPAHSECRITVAGRGAWEAWPAKVT